MTGPANPPRDLIGIIGFGIGTGLCTVALVGTYLRFWVAGTNGWLVTAGTLVAGFVLGALWAMRPTAKS